MTPRIQILPEQLCNKIAAGEVVERPASVVKELLENSLDAGAREIRIEIKGGGRRLIRVTDDGEGMGRDDVLLCLERHATSKIRSDLDLFHLHTLGFRGEALPSIASVSRLTLRSCPADTLEGWEVQAEGGVVKQTSVVGMARGTAVEIRDLFFNTPARRKFLRRDETELGHIADVVTRLALAHPHIHFRLLHDERSLLEARCHASLEERVAALLGRPLLRDLLPLEASGAEEMRLHGLISRPDLHRSATGSVFTFINGRYIRDRVVQHALLDGYRGVLEKGRYPVAVLFLEVAPEAVDVNVHPTKHEVRFREQAQVHDFITEAIRQRLRGADWLPGSPSNPGGIAAREPARPAPPIADRQRERVQEALLAYGQRQETTAPGDAVSFTRPAPFTPVAASPSSGDVAEPHTRQEKGYFSNMEVIGQFHRSYLLAQDGDDLVLIDQHAAHERIGFERLRHQYWQGRIEQQSLLFPAVLDVDFREGALLAEQLPQLERLGFEIEPFGPRSFAVKAVPRLLSDSDTLSLVREVAGELAAVGRSAAIEAAIERVLMLLACHGAVRANRGLETPEILALLAELDQVDFKGHCPHGRPVLQRLSLGEVERMFRRS